MVLFRFALLIALLLALCAQAGINTIADITGTGAAVQVSTNTQARAKWIQIIAPSTNSAVVRFGDSSVSATQGLPIAAGGGYNTPSCDSCNYSLSGTYVYIANGDKVSIAWGN